MHNDKTLSVALVPGIGINRVVFAERVESSPSLGVPPEFMEALTWNW